MFQGLYEIVAPLKDKFLNHQNYEEWRFHMTWSLISQDLWHVARRQNFFEITCAQDYLVTLAIKLTIEHPYSLKIWQTTFNSSQELWDYLRSEFGQQDSIELKFQRQEQKKMKKRAEQKQRNLKKQDLSLHSHDFLVLPVPELPDSYSASNYLEKFLEAFACMTNPAQDIGILEKDDDCLELRLDLSHLVVHSQFCEESHQVIQMLMDDADQPAGLHGTSNLLHMEGQLLDFPWMNLDVRTYDFDSIISQVYDDQCVTSSLANETVEERLSLSIEQSAMFFLVNDNMNLLESYDVSHLSLEFQFSEDAYDRQYQVVGLDEFDSCHIAENVSRDIIQQLEVPFLDDFLDLTDLSSMPQSVISDYGATNFILECNCESSINGYESMDQKLEASSLRHDQFFSWDEVLENPVHTADFKDDLILEFPWLELDSNSSVFQSNLSQVSTHKFPLYVNVHIPFACIHDGKMEDHNLDDCLGYISCADVEGVIKKLQLSYRCLHLRDQVFMIVDLAEDQNLVVSDNKSDTGPQGLPGKYVQELDVVTRWLEAYYGSPLIDEVSTKAEKYCMEHFGIARTQGTVGTYVLLVAREWYRGRKIWFKIKHNSHSWLLLWLSLLYFLSTA